MKFSDLLFATAGPNAIALDPFWLDANFDNDADLVLGSMGIPSDLAAASAGPSGVPLLKVGRTGIIPITGMILNGSANVKRLAGMTTDPNTVSAQAAAYANDPKVDSVLMYVNSGGGTVAGMTESVASIRALRDIKPVTAQVNHAALSAAYWFASQANEVVLSPGGMVGSIGVYRVHQDQSEAEEQAGIKTEYIYAGKNKLLGMSGRPLTDEGRAHIGEMVAESYDRFAGDVALGRGVPIETAKGKSFGSGAVLTQGAALSGGLVDKVAAFADTISAFNSAPVSGRNHSRRAALALLQIGATQL